MWFKIWGGSFILLGTFSNRVWKGIVFNIIEWISFSGEPILDLDFLFEPCFTLQMANPSTEQKFKHIPMENGFMSVTEELDLCSYIILTKKLDF